MKKVNEQKESLFIENYVNTGKAKESAMASGYNEKSASSMGYYLKQMTGLSVVMDCISYLLAAQI